MAVGGRKIQGYVRYSSVRRTRIPLPGRQSNTFRFSCVPGERHWVFTAQDYRECVVETNIHGLTIVTSKR